MADQADDKQAQDEPEQPERRLVSAFTEGGHEVDLIPSGRLTLVLVGLIVVIVACAVGLSQLVNLETGDLLEASAAQISPVLTRAIKRGDTRLTTYGTAEPKAGLYRIPAAAAEKLVLTHPGLFAPAPAPAGWVSPDGARKVRAPTRGAAPIYKPSEPGTPARHAPAGGGAIR